MRVLATVEAERWLKTLDAYCRGAVSDVEAQEALAALDRAQGVTFRKQVAGFRSALQGRSDADRRDQVLSQALDGMRLGVERARRSGHTQI